MSDREPESIRSGWVRVKSGAEKKKSKELTPDGSDNEATEALQGSSKSSSSKAPAGKNHKRKRKAPEPQEDKIQPPWGCLPVEAYLIVSAE
jgi:hypothetical protein